MIHCIALCIWKHLVEGKSSVCYLSGVFVVNRCSLSISSHTNAFLSLIILGNCPWASSVLASALETGTCNGRETPGTNRPGAAGTASPGALQGYNQGKDEPKGRDVQRCLTHDATIFCTLFCTHLLSDRLSASAVVLYTVQLYTVQLLTGFQNIYVFKFLPLCEKWRRLCESF